jgi:hypothetical protein
MSKHPASFIGSFDVLAADVIMIHYVFSLVSYQNFWQVLFSFSLSLIFPRVFPLNIQLNLCHFVLIFDPCFQEPSAFAAAKLLETGLVNLPRLEIMWPAVTRHLIEVVVSPELSKQIYVFV